MQLYLNFFDENIEGFKARNFLLLLLFDLEMKR